MDQASVDAAASTRGARSSRTIVFSNQKGGVGKSTLAVLYAQWLSDRKGLKVALVDLDTQCNSSKSLQSSAGAISSDQLFQACEIADDVRRPDGLTLIAGHKRLGQVELVPAKDAIRAFCTNMATLEQQFDAIVIDTPPALGIRMSAALVAGSAVVCPIELEDYSLDGVVDMMKTVYGIRQRYNPELQFAGMVANRFNGHSVRQKDALRDLVRRYSEFVVPAKVSNRTAIPESLSSGTMLWRMKKSSAREASAEVIELFGHLDGRTALPSGLPSQAPPMEVQP